MLEITRICLENHSNVTGWQELFFSYKSVVSGLKGLNVR